MLNLKETDKLTELIHKITEEHALKVKEMETEITQMTDLLIQDGILLKHIDSNFLEQENLISYCNTNLS